MVSLQPYIKYLPSQERVDCCTASSTLIAAELICAIGNRPKIFSRLYTYYMTRKLQGRQGLKGADLETTLKSLSIYGAASERLWPFSYHRVDVAPQFPVIEDAVHFKVESYEKIAHAQFKEALNNGIPIVLGMYTGRKFWRLNSTLETHNYEPVNETTNRPSKGHAVTCIGFNDSLNGGSWIIANSMGPKWGDQGYAAIPYSCNVDIAESFIITKFAGITAGLKISSN